MGREAENGFNQFGQIKMLALQHQFLADGQRQGAQLLHNPAQTLDLKQKIPKHLSIHREHAVKNTLHPALQHREGGRNSCATAIFHIVEAQLVFHLFEAGREGVESPDKA